MSPPRPGPVLAALAFSAILTTGAGAVAEDDPTPSRGDESAAADRSNRFGLGLYARLAGRPGNLCLSPPGLYHALAMAHAGARGETAEQLARLLHFPDGRKGGGVPVGRFNDVDGVRLDLAGSFWGQKGCDVVPAFLDVLKERYRSELHEVDFRDDPESARRTINAWASEHTGGKVRELLGRDEFDGETQLVLASVVAFKGAWAVPFRADRTRPGTFRVSAERKVSAPFMERTGSFRTAAIPGGTALELPYAGRRVSLVILLPRDPDGLPALERRLSPTSLAGWLRLEKHEGLTVSLPRFEMKTDLDLAEPLARIGAPLAFRPGAADFSGMFRSSAPLALSEIVHQVALTVDEAGTEAVAATAVRGRRGLPDTPEREFRADHPFVFLLRDQQTGTLLFLGRLTDPAR